MQGSRAICLYMNSLTICELSRKRIKVKQFSLKNFLNKKGKVKNKQVKLIFPDMHFLNSWDSQQQQQYSLAG